MKKGFSYFGPFLDNSNRNLLIAEQIEDTYIVGNTYKIDGRKWLCEKVTAIE